MRKALLTGKDTLTNLLYVSYLVPARRIADLIPRSLEIAAVDNAAFLSIVVFDNSSFELEGIHLPGLRYGEINIRTYVRSKRTGEFGMYLLDSGITSRVVRAAARVARIPWERLSLNIEAIADREGRYSTYEAAGDWGSHFTIRGHETASAPAALPPFDAVCIGLEYLTRPFIGYYSAGHALYRLDVYHQLIVPRVLEIDEILFPRALRNGVLTAEDVATPHSTLLVPLVDFTMYLPQHRVA